MKLKFGYHHHEGSQKRREKISLILGLRSATERGSEVADYNPTLFG